MLALIPGKPGASQLFWRKGETIHANKRTWQRETQVTGILYIIFGALGLSLSLALLAGGGLLLAAGAGTVGIALGAVAGILGAITVLTAVFYLILGILGVRNCDKPEKCGVNFVLGILVLVLVVIGLVVNVATTGPSDALSSVVGLVLSILYVMGAKENKDAHAMAGKV